MPYHRFLGEIQGKEAGIGMIGITEFLIMLASVSPALVLWIAVIIFAAVMLRRGGGRAERFLITGAGIKIIANLLRIPAAFITLWLVDGGHSMDYANSVSNYCGIFLDIIGMAGILCLIYAFWVKFKTGNLEGVQEGSEGNFIPSQ
jgi:hypothetical protein